DSIFRRAAARSRLLMAAKFCAHVIARTIDEIPHHFLPLSMKSLAGMVRRTRSLLVWVRVHTLERGSPFLQPLGCRRQRGPHSQDFHPSAASRRKANTL